MKAAVRDLYGGPDVIRVEDVAKPELTDDGALVRVHAASLNRVDWYNLKGAPIIGRLKGEGLRKPKTRELGIDFAGTVEAVGKDVTHVRPGDDVFGCRTGALAEYVNVRVGVVPKPADITVEQAACVGVAAITALQGLRDKGGLQPGQKVLINGAAGSVGTFAVQIAKALGADVTAVCSTRNVEQTRALGADRVIDYTAEDFTQCGEIYDLIFDLAGSKPFRAYKRILKPDAIFILGGVPLSGGLIGPLGHIARTKLAGMRASQKVVFYLAKTNREDLDVLREMMESGQVKPVVEQTYDLDDVAEAYRYLGTGHVRSKLVVTM